MVDGCEAEGADDPVMSMDQISLCTTKRPKHNLVRAGSFILDDTLHVCRRNLLVMAKVPEEEGEHRSPAKSPMFRRSAKSCHVMTHLRKFPSCMTNRDTDSFPPCRRSTQPLQGGTPHSTAAPFRAIVASVTVSVRFVWVLQYPSFPAPKRTSSILFPSPSHPARKALRARVSFRSN